MSEITSINFLESILYSLFGFGIVLLVLIGLIAVIKVITQLVGKIGLLQKSNASQLEEESEENKERKEMLAGELRLFGVDEKTAAMIMAIVSHESSIPLSELRFKSIKVID